MRMRGRVAIAATALGAGCFHHGDWTPTTRTEPRGAPYEVRGEREWILATRRGGALIVEVEAVTTCATHRPFVDFHEETRRAWLEPRDAAAWHVVGWAYAGAGATLVGESGALLAIDGDHRELDAGALALGAVYVAAGLYWRLRASERVETRGTTSSS